MANAVKFYNEYPDKDKCKMVKAILETHLPLHENIKETIESIIKEYRLSYDTRTLFIALVGIMKDDLS